MEKRFKTARVKIQEKRKKRWLFLKKEHDRSVVPP